MLVRRAGGVENAAAVFSGSDLEVLLALTLRLLLQGTW
jgi:hypothetical protein